jgi:Arc/MetJ-type ribon-helix-helix transcriptional regulator
MEDQITVRFPRELSRALRERASRMRRKPSEVVRMAVSEFLQIDEPRRRRSADLVQDLIGSLESGLPEMAIRHRELLVKKLRRGR